MNTLIFLAGCTAEAIALQACSTIVLITQQIFGIATVVVRLGTLFALTPLGSRVFKDGKVQPLPKSRMIGKEGTEVRNPIKDDRD